MLVSLLVKYFEFTPKTIAAEAAGKFNHFHQIPDSITLCL